MDLSYPSSCGKHCGSGGGSLWIPQPGPGHKMIQSRTAYFLPYDGFRAKRFGYRSGDIRRPCERPQPVGGVPLGINLVSDRPSLGVLKNSLICREDGWRIKTINLLKENLCEEPQIHRTADAV